MIRRVDPQVALHPAAGAEIAEALQWYRARDPALGRRLRGDIEHAVEMIVAMPDAWQAYLHGTRRYVLADFPYSVIYRCRAGAIQIIAVAHAKRRPGYWRKRL